MPDPKCTTTKATKGKAKKRTAAAPKVKMASASLTEFQVEYAKSSRSVCCGCQEKIVKGELRIAKMDTEAEEARKFGPIPRWHHVTCFAKLREELLFRESGTLIPGFSALEKEDQKTVKAELPEVKGDALPPPVKKVKEEVKEEADEDESNDEAELIREQSKQLFKIRDQLKAELRKKEWVELLEFNGINRPPDGDEPVNFITILDGL